MTWRNLGDVFKELTDDEIVAMDRYRPRPPLATKTIRKTKSEVMKQRFIEGTEATRETLTAEEKKAYRKGGWLGEGR